MRNRLIRPALVTLLLATAAFSSAAPLKPEDVPAPLKPWISWVLRGQEQALCSSFLGSDQKRCLWPGALKLSLDDKGGRFQQSWRIEAPGWAPLPGGRDHWPQDVKVDGAEAAVVRRDDAPAVWLKAGAHTLAGTFKWDGLPEHLDVSAETGMVTLTLRGKDVALPQRDDGGALWLQARSRPGGSQEEAHLDVIVHRKLVDESPLELVTRVQLKVSGPSRETVLARALPEGFIPMSLVSPIPARLDPDGRLRVQARAGLWELTLTARQEAPDGTIALSAPKGPWDSDEVWVFEARPDLRQADLTGPPSLDPQQTQLPPDWKSLPAYLVRPGAEVKLVQRRRGDDPPPADRLRIERDLWLDFDGGGVSARDVIQGTLNRSWRLEAARGTEVGRVAIGGEDQLLTVLTTGGPAGLEVRTGALTAVADSRFEGRRVPATGWNHDFDSAVARLRLPPGWRLLHAGGVDQSEGTWTSDWTLLDFFLVLVCAGAFSKLYGRRWGLAALAMLVLIWQEPGAPRWLWLLVLTAAAARRALASHADAGSPAKWAHRIAWGLLAVAAIPFVVCQARTGLYPVLERGNVVYPLTPGAELQRQQAEGPLDKGSFFPGRIHGPVAALAGSGSAFQGVASEQRAQQMDFIAPVGAVAGGSFARSAPVPSPLSSAASRYEEPYPKPVPAQMRMARDPNARVTTGAGIPYWQWSSVLLSWSGPVPRDHRMTLWLLPPSGNLMLSAARILLVAALTLLLFGFPVERWLERLRPGSREGRALMLLALLLGCAAPLRAQAFPPKELLDELRAGLLERHECEPQCADSARMTLTAEGSWLKLSLSVQGAAATAVPLPSGGREWSPSRATLDGAPASVLRADDGQLWAVVPAGSHELALEGALPDRDSVQLGLPLKPHRVEARLSGWTLQGLREDGRPESSLQLSRTRAARTGSASDAGAKAQGVFPPFLLVSRTLRLGLSWTVETRVTRLTPVGTPVVAEVPLLPGESVTSPDVRVVKGKARVTLPAQQSGLSWSSVLAESDALKLEAARTTQWAEDWRLEPGPMWHVAVKGLPPIHQEDDGRPRSYEFRPWPGESVDVAIRRPAPLPGRTMTVDQAVTTLSPGLRATDGELSLSIRSSRGGQHAVTLPKDAELLSVSVDGAVQPLRLEGRVLTVPLQPGSHAVQADWRQPGGMGLVFRAPELDAGASSVNDHVLVTVPGRRWVLLTVGRGLGPVVLFWSLLFLAALASYGLAASALTPLSAGAWFLLALGLMQDRLFNGVLVAAWFLAVGLKNRFPPKTPREKKWTQAFLVGLTALSAACLFSAIAKGLLGQPDMQITGNGSTAHLLRWYVDRSPRLLPRPMVLSLPLWLYRCGMLAWALWLAQSLLSWVPWAWGVFAKGGLWPRKETER